LILPRPGRSMIWQLAGREDISHTSGGTMCYEIDELYWRQRAEEVRRALEKTEELKRQTTTTAPAKPASPGKKTEVKVPVPA
jgi:hypothetical protein